MGQIYISCASDFSLEQLTLHAPWCIIQYGFGGSHYNWVKKDSEQTLLSFIFLFSHAQTYNMLYKISILTCRSSLDEVAWSVVPETLAEAFSWAHAALTSVPLIPQYVEDSVNLRGALKENLFAPADLVACCNSRTCGHPVGTENSLDLQGTKIVQMSSNHCIQ